MVEVHWQSSLIKFAATITCVGVLLVAAVALVTAAQPRGPDGGEPGVMMNATLPIVLISVAAALILIAGVFRDMEAVTSKLPRCSGWRFLGTMVFILILLPVLNLSFVCAVFMAVLATTSMLPSLKLRVRAVAVCDALLCLALTEVMRQAGPVGDYGVARGLLGLYVACGGVVLPGLAWLSTVAYLPRVSSASCVAYIVAALHAAVIILQAVGTFLSESIDGSNTDYEGSGCLRSTIDSPVSLVLGLLRDSLESAKYSGPQRPVDPCGGRGSGAGNAGAAPEAACDTVGFGVLLYFLAVGAYGLLAVAALACSGFRARVVPVHGGDLDAHVKQDTGNMQPSVLGHGEKHRHKHRHRQRVLAALNNPAVRAAGILSLVGGAIVIAAIGIPVLSCPSSSRARLLHESSAQAALGTNSSANSTNGTNGTAGSRCPPEAEAPVVPAASPAAAQAGCRCGEPGSRGFQAWAAVPAEQFARTWCQLGAWAPLGVGLLMYCCHGYAYSLAKSQRAVHSARGRKEAYKREMARRLQRSRETGCAADGSADQAPGRILAALQGPMREEMPLPTRQVDDTRVFNV